jgi:hypothetical protein
MKIKIESGKIVKQGAGLLNKYGKRYKAYPATLYQPGESLGDSLNFTAEQAVRNIEIGLNTAGIEL